MPTVRYREIADDLRRRITAGEWRPGENLPRQTDLADEFGVSRNVIARAVSELENEGLVWAVPRRGTIVRPAKRRRIVRGNLVRRNTRHVVDGKPASGGYSFPAASGDELWVHHVPPQATVESISGRAAKLLNVPEGSDVLRRRRVTGPPNEPPFQMSDTWIHPRGVADAPAVAEQGAGPGGWLDRLEEAGHGPIEWMEIHLGRLPTEDEAALLQIPTGLPVQEVTRVGYSGKDEKAIEVTVVVIPSDRVENIIQLKRDTSAVWPHPDAGPDGPPVAGGRS